MNLVNEATVEGAVLGWLRSAGWSTVHGPTVGPETAHAERDIKREISYLTLYNGECEETRWSLA